MTALRLRSIVAAVVVAVLAVVAVAGDEEEPALSAGLSDQIPVEVLASPEPSTHLTDPEGSVELVGREVVDVAISPIVRRDSSRSERGAIQAAVALLEATEEVVAMTPTDAAQTQALLSTRASAGRLSAAVEQQVIEMRAQAPQGLRVWIAPVEARATETEVGFDVAIWYAQVVAIGTETVVDNWSTVSYSLVWEDQAWKMDDSVSVPGPTPARSAAQTPTPAGALVGVLSGYSDEALLP